MKLWNMKWLYPSFYWINSTRVSLVFNSRRWWLQWYQLGTSECKKSNIQFANIQNEEENITSKLSNTFGNQSQKMKKNFNSFQKKLANKGDTTKILTLIKNKNRVKKKNQINLIFSLPVYLSSSTFATEN